MDKAEIKKILKEQFEPMDNAVKRKLKYLQSDDVFTEEYATDESDISLMNAFGENMISIASPLYPQPSAREFYQSSKEKTEPKYVSEPTSQSIDEHKQNIAAKIAALRGISMPGDYLKRK